MSIGGIGGGLAGAGGLGLPRERGVDRADGLDPQNTRGAAEGGAAGAVQQGASSTDRTGEVRGLESATLPAEAPRGTDPELWSVLTTEERAFYARAHALGPLTYGRDEVQSAQESIGRGGRLDLRV